MAIEAPDPRTFKTWEDAFQYPIPVVRKLEQQLRSNASENREKLRSLVGASYRDLLDTAETIVDMEASMQTVESKLAKVGQDCNSRNLDRIGRNAAKSALHNRERKAEKYTFASQLAVLRNCPVVMARLMKSEGSYLLIAKVLVLSRLLHKALSEGGNAPPIVEQLRDKLGSLRARLLRRIDRRLARAAGETELLVESMCAYSLATSSTPTDVLKHFHHVRLKEVSGLLQNKEGLKESGNRALKLCLQTSQDTQTVFPRRLAEALARLKLQPLAQDADVRGLFELNLDIHDRWIGEDARNYTPRPRHDELQRGEAERLLHQWSKQAISAFLKGIKSALEDTTNMKEVAELRQDLIETWILSGSRMAGVKSKNVLDDLRDAMMGQLENIVRSRTQNLRSVVEEISSTLGSWDHQDTSLSLWTATSTASSLSNGAQAFKERILNTHQGRDDAVIHIIQTFDVWMASVLEVKLIVKSMKETRWDDPFTDSASLSSSSNELSDGEADGHDSKQTLLSADDPRLLEEVTQDALAAALSSLGKSFAHLDFDAGDEDGHDGEGEEEEDGNGNTGHVQKAVFLLRVIREISGRIPRLRVQDKSSLSSSSNSSSSAPGPLTSPFTASITTPLHRTLATAIVRPTISAYQSHLSKSVSIHSQAKSKSHILWEGNPPLPAQPSPSAFRFLQDLVKRMGGYGADLWASESVGVVKVVAWEEVGRCWVQVQEGFRVGERGGEGDGEGYATRDTETPEVTEETEGTVEGDADANGNADADESQTKDKGNDAEPEPEPESPSIKAQDQNQNEARSKSAILTLTLRQDTHKQLLFDALYLQRFLAPAADQSASTNTSTHTSTSTSTTTSSAAINALYEAAGVDEAMRLRLNKHAGEYWRKTYLLLALLA
ncbi:hypothetical protein K491DRAFT_688555 [Lophiostoma macrostomum CBS 122681]|uniref:Conserved oligomeric Golgi complex subunit 1 n=1 Tax=Lophiostoma macrostomum CBS 122681 TaxID=1314788 RepID=A0A6A6TJK0_9PLEO|nr:hypothetical protein K491DRAFT_688555 [Lophiostoma macrostomum CBS 122681]